MSRENVNSIRAEGVEVRVDAMMVQLLLVRERLQGVPVWFLVRCCNRN